MRVVSRYNTLKRRRAAWRRELNTRKSKYPRKLILATIAAINAELITCLKDRSP